MPGRPSAPVEFIAGANMGFRKEVFKAIGGFQAGRRRAHDMECILRARAQGFSIFFEPRAIVQHIPKRTRLSTIFRYAAKHASETILLRQRFRDVLRTPSILRSPFLLLFSAPLIALHITVGIYCANLARVKQLHTLPIVYALKIAWCCGAASGLLRKRNSLPRVQGEKTL